MQRTAKAPWLGGCSPIWDERLRQAERGSFSFSFAVRVGALYVLAYLCKSQFFCAIRFQLLWALTWARAGAGSSTRSFPIMWTCSSILSSRSSQYGAFNSSSIVWRQFLLADWICSLLNKSACRVLQ